MDLFAAMLMVPLSVGFCLWAGWVLNHPKAEIVIIELERIEKGYWDRVDDFYQKLDS